MREQSIAVAKVPDLDRLQSPSAETLIRGSARSWHSESSHKRPANHRTNFDAETPKSLASRRRVRVAGYRRSRQANVVKARQALRYLTRPRLTMGRTRARQPGLRFHCASSLLVQLTSRNPVLSDVRIFTSDFGIRIFIAAATPSDCSNVTQMMLEPDPLRNPPMAPACSPALMTLES